MFGMMLGRTVNRLRARRYGVADLLDEQARAGGGEEPGHVCRLTSWKNWLTCRYWRGEIRRSVKIH
ncbi:hypothetical protein KCP73_00910 [Salmonella enterica subsp. enterica]|nr:hypothetical protein KCP73_00910 [Salmonella enterica subsp. enterica]